MSKTDSTVSARARKGLPPKPKGFPLGPHPNGHWQKRICGRLYYFGPWGHRVNGKLVRLPDDGKAAAKALYESQKDDLYAGRDPQATRTTLDGITVGELRERFLVAKSRKLDAKRINRGTYMGYRATADLLLREFGERRKVADLTAKDFEALLVVMQQRWPSVVRLGNEIGRVKSVFKYAYENGDIGRTVRFGSEFKKPSASEVRLARAAKGEQMLEAAAIRKLLGVEDPLLQAMVLLGVNCGFKAHDCAKLRLEHLDLDGAWINFPRPKTGVKRRCPLWAETVAALRAYLVVRPAAKAAADQDLVFVTSRGRAYSYMAAGKPARAAMQTAQVHRRGFGLATLRHVFETVAGASRDQVAVNAVMGHADQSMAGVYRERIDDARLRAVTDVVHAWLFPKGGAV